MTKEELIRKLQEAKRSHLEWMELAKKLIRGDIETLSIPVSDSACAFGRWMVDEGRVLKQIPGFEVLEYVKKVHMDLHEAFEELFHLCYGSSLGLFVAKVFGIRKKARNKKICKAYKKMLRSSRELQKKLDQLLVAARFVKRGFLQNLR